MDYSYFDSEPLLYQSIDVHSTPFPLDRVGHRTMVRISFRLLLRVFLAVASGIVSIAELD